MISIVIPTCNSKLVNNCLISIEKYTDLNDVEIIIVANGVEKGSEKIISSSIVSVLLWFDDRIGATRALNEGIKIAKGEYIILLNDDVTILGKEWLPMLLNPFSDPKIGITGPIKTQTLDRYFVSFFCCAIRKKVFDELGILDEIFSPGSYEDVDFCFKAEDAGWKFVQVPDIQRLQNNGQTLVGGFPIWHIFGSTVNKIDKWEDVKIKNLKIINDRYDNVMKIDWHCWQKKPELNRLLRFLKDHKIEKILEIGTDQGGTAVVWAKIVEPHNGKVYCVDQLFDKGPVWRDGVFYERQIYDTMSIKKFITEIQGNSHDPDFKIKVSNEIGQVDLLFIDGDHSYEGVKDDFYSFSKLVKPGGFIVFHDIVDSEFHRSMGVYIKQFWEEIKIKYEYLEFIDENGEYKWIPRESMGIGVLKMP